MLFLFQTDIFLVCFSLVDKVSFGHVESIWMPEIKETQSQPSLILIGNYNAFTN